MNDPDRIYLQPECCADPDVGRLWCEHDEPVECEDGVPWTEYVRVGPGSACHRCGAAQSRSPWRPWSELEVDPVRKIFALDHKTGPEVTWSDLGNDRRYTHWMPIPPLPDTPPEELL